MLKRIQLQGFAWYDYYRKFNLISVGWNILLRLSCALHHERVHDYFINIRKSRMLCINYNRLILFQTTFLFPLTCFQDFNFCRDIDIIILMQCFFLHCDGCIKMWSNLRALIHHHTTKYHSYYMLLWQVETTITSCSNTPKKIDSKKRQHSKEDHWEIQHQWDMSLIYI